MIYYISRTILWLLFKICFRYRIKGRKNVPVKGPFILASNHLSFLDPIAVGFITMRQVRFVARGDLFTNKIFAWWAAKVGVVPIKRGRLDLSAIKAVLEKLKEGCIVALFPEGTRSDDGVIKDPKGGVGFLAVGARTPVLPVLVRGTDKALPRHSFIPRFKPVEVRVAQAVEPSTFGGKDDVYDYRALTMEVMNRIRGLNED